MDYNKLINGIIKAAKKDPVLNIANPETTSDHATVTTTLRVEVKVSKIFSEKDCDEAVNSTKFIFLKIED